jgi:hypothetical protein
MLPGVVLKNASQQEFMEVDEVEHAAAPDHPKKRKQASPALELSNKNWGSMVECFIHKNHKGS